MRVLLFLEAVLLAGPITGLVAYLSVPALLMYFGIALGLFLGHPQGGWSGEDSPFLAALVSLPLGIFALAQLWVLSVRTAQGRPYRFGRTSGFLSPAARSVSSHSERLRCICLRPFCRCRPTCSWRISHTFRGRDMPPNKRFQCDVFAFGAYAPEARRYALMGQNQ